MNRKAKARRKHTDLLPLSVLLVWDSPRKEPLSIVVGDTLRTLDLSGAALGATHALWVAKGLAKNPVLEVLDLSNNVLCEEGLRSIGRGLKSNSHLRSLYLSNVLEKGQEDGSGFSSLFKRSPQHLRDLLKSKDVAVAMSAWLSTLKL